MCFDLSFCPSCRLPKKKETTGLLRIAKIFLLTLEINDYIILVRCFWDMISIVLSILGSL